MELALVLVKSAVIVQLPAFPPGTGVRLHAKCNESCVTRPFTKARRKSWDRM